MDANQLSESVVCASFMKWKFSKFGVCMCGWSVRLDVKELYSHRRCGGWSWKWGLNWFDKHDPPWKSSELAPFFSLFVCQQIIHFPLNWLLFSLSLPISLPLSLSLFSFFLLFFNGRANKSHINEALIRWESVLPCFKKKKPRCRSRALLSV